MLPAQAIPIAVVEFEANGIPQTEAIALTDRLRNELFRLGAFEVVERDMMGNILREQDFQMAGCTSNECLVEVGQLLGARQVIGGRISRVGTIFTVSARVVDVQTGKLLGVSDFDLRGGLEEMLTSGMKQVAVMLAGGEDASRPAAAQPALQPEQPATSPRETAAQQEQPSLLVSSELPKFRRWQSRIGVWNNSFSLSFSYDLQSELNLWGTQFQPVVSGGYLRHTYTINPEQQHKYDSENFYGMLEVHKKWSSSGGNLGASVYPGIGLCDYSGYY